MVPIKNIVTSALMLTAAVAAPVELDRKSHAIADAVSWMKTDDFKK
jgi:starvation-inducible outer membrane lipoprotein